MRVPTRIRLLKVPSNRERELTYPGIVVKVVDTRGDQWVVPTLAEGMVHLRSSEGARLVIEDFHLEWLGPPLQEAGRKAGWETTDRLVIDRLDDEFVVREVHAGPDERDPDFMHDLSLDPPVRLIGRMTQKVVDVDVDLPRPVGSKRLPAPRPRRA